MIALGELQMNDGEEVALARQKVLRLVEDVGLGAIDACRVAAVTSEVGRRAGQSEAPASLVIEADTGGHLPKLRLTFQMPDLVSMRPLLEAFFDRVALPEAAVAHCWVTVPQADALTGDGPEHLRARLCERSRAELLRDLARQNQALEQHRAQLESTVEDRTAELRAATQRAERANRAKSEFLSHMSHELRTPLNGVLGHSQILLRSGDVTPAQRKSLSAIDSSGRHLLTLINDILDLSKIEAGELELEEGPCDLRSLVLDVCHIIRPTAERKGVTVKQEIGHDVPRAILSDPTKLRQCLVNIAGNAAKFTERGEITVRVQVSGPQLLLEVADTGVGIPEHELARMFQPFKQAEAGRLAGGSGLGLAISRRLVERLDGELSVQSAVGRGTTFRIALPCKTVGAAHAEDRAMPEHAYAGQRLAAGQSCAVLIVDDNETNRDVLASILQPVGFDIALAEDGLQALEQMRSRPFDLVLMDLRMPRMTGEEALGVIRSDPALANSKVMAVTASLESALMERLGELGFDDVLSKPFVVGALLDRITKLTGVTWAPAPLSDGGPHQPSAAAELHLSATVAQEVWPQIRNALLVGDLQAMDALGTALQTRPEPGLAQLGLTLCDRCGEFDMQALETLGARIAEMAGQPA